jgi:hypothetical protein
MSNEEQTVSGGKNKYLIVVIAVIVGGAGFFAGTKYQQGKPNEFSRNLPENIEQMRGQMGQHRTNGSSGLTTVRGEIISIDNSSVTVKLNDDSSKIIILADSTGINKSEEGSIEDLSEGTEVMVIGQTNSDGSVTASNIQIGTWMFREAAKQQE